MNILKFNSNRKRHALIVATACSAISLSAWAASYVDPYPTQFSNTGSIKNTRHNLTFTPPLAALDQQHKASRNSYGEVCVYCHTPHGANNTIAAPLWNRTIKVTNYQTYDELGTTSLTGNILPTPGPASLTCLSCHDGQTAVDAIINMPGSGSALATGAQIQAAQTVQDTAFLNLWDNPPPGAAGPETTNHRGMNSTNNVYGNGTGSDNLGCLTCHSPDGAISQLYGTQVGHDMRMANLGTDLRNDHPIGIVFPALNGAGTDWNTPAGVKGTSQYFDTDPTGVNGRMDKSEIRTYEGRVECASCHDPHGVPGAGGVFKPTFLRVDNSQGSATCLTCHNK